jgi:hypothetical protein
MRTDSVLFPVFLRQGKSRTRFKVGYINRRGETVIAANFDEGTRFYEGLAAVRVKSRWGVINANGDFAIQPILWSWCRFRDGLASMATRNRKWGVIDRAGQFIVQPKYDWIGPFQDGLAPIKVCEREKRRYGFVDKTGAEVILPKFHDARAFSEGLAAAKIANLWGYVGPSGVFKITPRFDGTGPGKRWPDTRAGRFVNGLAPVWSSQDDFRFIDTTGCYAFEVGFDDANSFSEGRAAVKRGNRYGFIDTEGRIRIEYRFTLARDFSEGMARVTEKESRVGFAPPSGFIDPEGQMIIQPTFFSAESFRDGLCLVTTQDSIGYINRSGEFVWQGPYVEYGVVC